MDENPLTHISPEGGVRMVDVSEKPVTAREAVARGKVLMNPETLSLIAQGRVPKGDVLGVAQVAGIMAAKKTPDLIPLCHPLELGGVEVRLSLEPDAANGAEGRNGEPKIGPDRGKSAAVLVEARVKVKGQTGAEMEALTAVSAACLAVYDMCKAVDKSMIISDVRLVAKSGGQSGAFMREGEKIG